MDELKAAIDELLTEQRPDRYEPSEASWLDSVADQVKDLVSPEHAVFKFARKTVGDRERAKTQSTNKLLRDVHTSGEFPLEWLETLHLPLAVGKERVALRACTAQDFRDFANQERRVASNDFATRNASCEAAEWIADQMTDNGWTFGRQVLS